MQLASSSHDSIVYVCSLQNENSIATCEKLASHTAYVNCVRWSRDGKYLASASGDYNVKIWNGMKFEKITIQKMKKNECKISSKNLIEMKEQNDLNANLE